MRRVLPLLALLAVVTCDSGPKEGELLVSLASPNPQDGAVAFTLTAADPETILSVTAACAGCQVFTYRVSETTVRGVVTGPVVQGDLVRVTVSNIKSVEAYTASVQAAASPAYAVRATGGYVLTVEKP